MWEAIKSNQRRSRILISLMAVLLVTLGTLIGMTLDPRAGGPVGGLVALGVYFVMLLSALFAGNDILLSAAGARPIAKEDAPRLWNVIEEMTIAAGLPVMPAVYVIDEDSPNAFAVGRRPEKAAVAVTSGLLKRLTRDELQGVIAHEIGHIKNQDTRFLTIAAVMMGAITLLSDIFLRGLRFGVGGSRRSSRDSDSGGGQIQLIIFVITILAAILAPFCAQVLYFACSRRREYLADASAARFTRYPEGLASALEKIAGGQAFAQASRVVAPMYIVNPLRGLAAVGLFSTHPPTELRIKVLRAMGGRAGLSDYETAFQQVQGGKGALGRLTLAQADSLAAREATPEPEPREEMIERAKETASLTGRMGQMITIPCGCGLTIKLPPEFPSAEVKCPRCGTQHAVPQASPSVPAPEAAPPQDAPQMLRYERQGAAGWESFRCGCGQTLQLSPLFGGTHIQCPKCKRKVEIVTRQESAAASPVQNE